MNVDCKIIPNGKEVKVIFKIEEASRASSKNIS